MGRKIFKVIITFSLFVQPASVFAENLFLSCEAARLSGTSATLERENYENITPTIIIDSQKKEVSYSYFAAERRWEQSFQIIDEDKFNIVGYEFMTAIRTTTFHFNKKDKTFSVAFIGEIGNTLTYGRCFDKSVTSI
jgi:hypothetical protein